MSFGGHADESSMQRRDDRDYPIGGAAGSAQLGEFNSIRIADGKLEEGSSKISIQYVQQFSPITSPRAAAAEALSGCVYSRLAVCDSHVQTSVLGA